jgi:hypothetical protein
MVDRVKNLVHTRCSSNLERLDGLLLLPITGLFLLCLLKSGLAAGDGTERCGVDVGIGGVCSGLGKSGVGSGLVTTCAVALSRGVSNGLIESREVDC